MAKRVTVLGDLERARRSVRLGGAEAQPLRRKTASDRAKEPSPLYTLLDRGDRSELEGPSNATNLHIDAQTGAAVIERNGRTIIDGSGRDSEADEQRERSASGKGFDENLALNPAVPLATIAARLYEEIEAANQERRDWEEMGNKGIDYLGIKHEEASSTASAEGTISKAHDPMLLEAGLRSWANSRAELLPAGGPVKVRDDNTATADQQMGGGQNQGLGLEKQPPDNAAPQGIVGPGAAPPSPPQQQPGQPTRSEKADALERDMNHYLTVTDKEYYADTSKMLLTRAFKGTQFKKVYFDPLLRRPVSRWVKGTDLVVSNDGSSLAGVSLKAERSLVRRSVIKRMQKIGQWRTCSFSQAPPPTPTSTDLKVAETEGISATPTIPEKNRYTFYECYTELDDGPLGMDENGVDTGLCLPYRVTFEWESRQIVEIRRNWKEGDELFRERQRYVKYGFIPGFGFYDWGYFHILGSPQRALTAMTREFIDSEMLASFPGGVKQQSPGDKERTNLIRPGVGEFEVINTGGQPLRDFIMPWPYKGASPQLPAAIQSLRTAAKQLTGALEMPVGEGRAGLGQTPVGTIMAFIDAVSKVPSAVHKDDHVAQQEEFELLRELLAEHPECLTSAEGRTWTADELNDHKLVPAADPNTPSAMHRIMQGAALIEAASLPLFGGIADPRGLWKRVLSILGLGDQHDLTIPPPPPGAQPPPDPRAIAAQGKIANDQQKNEIAKAKLQQEQVNTEREAAAQSVEAEQREKDRQSEQDIENTRLQVEQLRANREHAHELTRSAMEHEREVGGAVAEHLRETRAQNLQHQQHRETLAQEDRHHAADAAKPDEETKP